MNDDLENLNSGNEASQSPKAGLFNNQLIQGKMDEEVQLPPNTSEGNTANNQDIIQTQSPQLSAREDWHPNQPPSPYLAGRKRSNDILKKQQKTNQMMTVVSKPSKETPAQKKSTFVARINNQLGGPNSINYSDHRRRVDFVKQLSPTLPKRLVNSQIKRQNSPQSADRPIKSQKTQHPMTENDKNVVHVVVDPREDEGDDQVADGPPQTRSPVTSRHQTAGGQE